MVFTGSSAIKLEYEEEASRRMLKNTICPLNYSQHLKLKYKEEYAQPVIFDINRLEQMGLEVIKDDIVTIQNNRVRHDTVVVASIIYNLLKEKGIRAAKYND